MITWDIYSNPVTGEVKLVETNSPAPEGFIYEAVTSNPEYLSLDNVK